MHRKQKTLTIAVVAIVFVVAVRAALPEVIERYVNRRLQTLQSYEGSIGDIDLALWRGAYRIDGIRIVKTGAEQPTPFFDCDAIEFSVEWRSLLQGSLVAEGTFHRPTLNLVQARSEQDSQLGKEVNWAQQLEKLFPFRFNTVEIELGTVTFRVPGIRTEDALTAKSVNGSISNLTNVVESNKETFADFAVTANILDDAGVKIDGSVDPVAPQPTFDINVSMDKVQLPKVNPWLRQFIKADAEHGDFALYAELAAADGRFKGYVKPLMQNVEIYGVSDKEKSLPKRLWEGVVEFAAEVFENQSKDQVGARIPFSGSIDNPRAGVLQTIVSVLRNAFIGAFAHSLEGSISVRDVKKNLKELDTTEEPKKKKQKEGRDIEKH